jgi:O-methyltransferase domain
MGHVLHGCNLDQKKQLISAAYDALPDGGAFIVIQALIDDSRRENVAGLMMSLNMLIEFGDAFDFTGSDFARWCREAGFRDVEVLPLTGPESAGIARK